jgi:AraC-like DNA-binding protein
MQVGKSKARAAKGFTMARPLDGLLAVEAVSDRAFPRHTHDCYGIGVLVGGAQRSASGRGPVEAHEGQVITVNPNEVHDGIPIGNAERAWKMIYFAPELLARILPEVAWGAELHHPVLASCSTAGTLLSLHAAAMAGEEAQETAENLLPGVLAPLLSRKAGPTAAQARGISRAAARIDDAPEAPHPVAQLAAEAGLSHWHFIRAFSAATGLTPQAYRRQRQVQKARKVIESGVPLAEAAAAAGFADQSHMTRLFTRCYGFTPGTLANAVASAAGGRPRATARP